MTTVKQYRVIDGPLGIREAPTTDSNRHDEELEHGEIVTIKGDLVTADDYIWGQHEHGWSAIATASQKKVYMLNITQYDENTPFIFRVRFNGLSVREAPGKSGKHTPTKLKHGQVIRVFANSRTIKDNIVWWKHKAGWSAETTLSRHRIYMKELVENPYLEIPEEQKAKIPESWTGIKLLQVTENGVKARSKPTTDWRVQVNRYLSRGEILQCKMDTITEADNYYWVKHEHGWSAIQSVNGREKYLVEPGTNGMPNIGPDGPVRDDLPGRKSLIQLFPIALSNLLWFQYYGNNMFAIAYGHKWYRRTQGLHSGLDFGSNNALKIFAGVEATYIKTIPSPGNTKIYLKNGDYQFIYQHVNLARQFERGDIITPDTHIGNIDTNVKFSPHLHFEVRYTRDWVINPLWLLSDDLYDQLIKARNPDKANTGWPKYKSKKNFFYHSDEWDRWVTPLEQPNIKLNGPKIGPRAELDDL